jgi:SHS2 domain-containing protein
MRISAAIEEATTPGAIGLRAEVKEEPLHDADHGWSHFPHGADIGIEGRGATLAKAFENAALALTAAVTSATIESSVVLELSCEARDPELLFVEWLNAIIYEMATRNMVFGRFQVRLSDGRLQGKLWGEAVDRARHEPACEPKGATYTALQVSQSAMGTWTARCVVDV